MELEQRTLSRVTIRLVPFLIVCYFIAYLDRVNVGFAALTMNRDLGLSQTAYGLGAGIFFFTYFLFEVPSNLFLARFGARRWIARIMLTWGVLSRTEAQHFSIGQALVNGRVLALSLVYFGVVASLYGLSFFLPQIVKQFGVSTQQNSFISAIPFVIGTVATLVWGRLSDKTGNRKGLIAIALFLTAAGIAAAAVLDDPLLKMIAFCVAAFGIFGTLAVFWTLPTAFLSGIAAAGGIAVINSIGNLAGFAGPYAMGAIKDATSSYQGGLFLLAGLALIAMVIVLALRHDSHLEQAPVLTAAAAE